jgi:hypothetical protein
MMKTADSVTGIEHVISEFVEQSPHNTLQRINFESTVAKGATWE